MGVGAGAGVGVGAGGVGGAGWEPLPDPLPEPLLPDPPLPDPLLPDPLPEPLPPDPLPEPLPEPPAARLAWHWVSSFSHPSCLILFYVLSFPYIATIGSSSPNVQVFSFSQCSSQAYSSIHSPDVMVKELTNC